MRARNKSWTLVLPALLLSVASCGELSDLPGDGSEFVAESMTLNLHEAYLMVGDEMQLTADVEPDDVKLSSIMWWVDNPKCLRLKEYGLAEAQQPGDTYLNAILESNLLQDRCLVHVLPRWLDIDFDDRQYDMVVYAADNIDGKPLSDKQVLVAMVDDEVRGRAKVRHFNQGGERISYLEIRIYSDSERGEQVGFRLYDKSDYTLRKSTYTITFDGERHGTISDLIPISF